MRFRHLTSAVAQILLNASGGAILQASGTLVIGTASAGQGTSYVYDTNLELQSTLTGSGGYYGNEITIGENKFAVSTHDGNSNGGKVYIYNHDGSGEQVLTASDGANGNSFGATMDMFGDTLVVAAPEARKIYIYDLSAADIAASEVKIHKSAIKDFGRKIGVGGGKVVVATIENNTTWSGSKFITGSAFVYDIDGTNEVQLIPQQNGHTLGYQTTDGGNRSNDEFGKLVAIGGDKIFVGARMQGNDDKGAVYVFSLDGTYETMITASSPVDGSYFAAGAIAVTDTKLVVTAPEHSIGIYGGKGTVYVFDHDGSNEVNFQSQHATSTMGRQSVAVLGNRIIVEWQGANSGKGQLHVFDMDGSNESVISPPPGIGSNDLWGNEIDAITGAYPMKMFVAEGRKTQASDQKIYVMDIDGENLIELPLPQGLSQPASSRFGDNIEVSGTNLVAIDPHAKRAYVYDLTSTNEPTSFSLDSTISLSATDNFVLEGNRLIVNRNPDASPGRILVYNITNGNLDASFANSDNVGFKQMDVGNGKIVANSGAGATRKVYVYDIDDTTGASETIIIPSSGATENIYNPWRVAVGNGKIVVGDSHTDATFYIYNLDGSNEIAVDCSNIVSSSKRVGYKSIAIGNDKIVVDGGTIGVALVCDLDGSGLFAIDLSNSSYGLSPDEYAGAGTESPGDLSIINNKIIIAASQGRVSGNETDGIVYTFDLDGTNMKQIVSPRATGSGYKFGTDIAANDPTGLTKFANLPAVISNIDASYTLTEGQDTVITGTAVDPEGDAITWSYEEVKSGPSYIAVGVYGDDDNGSSSGSVYVYDANDLSAQPTKLTAFDGVANDMFGASVAVSGDKIIVGAYFDDDAGTDSGSVYVYDTNDLSAQPTKLTAFDGAVDDLFGLSVATSDDKIVVRASLDDDNGSSSGSVYVYDANDLSAQPTKLTAFDAAANDRFGASVAVSADKIVIGAYADDDKGSNSGSVYVFDTNDLTAQPTKLTAFDGAPGDSFGRSISATADKIIVSASYDDDNGSLSGSVYVYDANNLSATPTKLTAFDGAANDYFGYSVAATADKIIVGAYRDDENATDSGSVYVYDANDLSATPTKLTAFDATEGANFGNSVTATASKIVVGADQTENNGIFSGSVYVYDANDLSAQPTKLTAFDGAGNDRFGHSVSLSSAQSALNGVTVTQSDNVFTITPASTDANFTLRFKVTDAAGNVSTKTSTFAYDYVNKAPVVTGIVSNYNLTQGQDTVITAVGTDPEGDAITWSFEEVTSGSYTFVQQPYWTNSGGSTIGRVVVYETSDLNTPVAYLSNPNAGVQDADGLNVSAYNGKIYVSAHGVSVGGTDNIGAVGVYDAETFEFLHNITPPDAPSNPHHYFSADHAPVVHEGKIYIGAKGRANNYGAVYVFDETTYDHVLFIESDYPNQGLGGTIKIHNGILYVSQTQAREPGTNNSVGRILGFNIDSLAFNNNPFSTSNKLEDRDADFIIYGSTTQTNQYFGRTFDVNDNYLVVGSAWYDDGGNASSGTIWVLDVNDSYNELIRFTPSDAGQYSMYGYITLLTDDDTLFVSQVGGNDGKFFKYDLSGGISGLTNSAETVELGSNYGYYMSLVENKLYVGAQGGADDKLYVYDVSDLSIIHEFGPDSDVPYGTAGTESIGPSSLNGVTVTQSDNVFTVTPGTADADFQLRITATDSEGNATSVTPTFDYEIPVPVVNDTSVGRIIAAASNNTYSNKLYAFDLDGSNEKELFIPAGMDNNSQFGADENMAIDGTTLVVGQRTEQRVFVYDLATTNEPIEITPSAPSTLFSTSVAISDGKIIVGAWEGGSGLGEFYIYDLDGSNEIKVTEPSAGLPGAGNQGGWTKFGFKVAAGHGRIVVGAPMADADGVTDSGQVYIYDMQGTFINTISATDGQTVYDQFGDYEIAIGNGKIAVTAISADGGSINSFTGSVYLYDLDGSNEVRLYDPALTGSARFGTGLAIGHEKVVVGSDNGAHFYIFDLDGSNMQKIASTGNSRISVANNRIVVGDYGKNVSESASGELRVYDMSGNLLNTIHQSNPTNSAFLGSSLVMYDTADARAHNFAPTVTGIQSTYTLTQGQDTVITAAATDPEGDAITWSFEEVGESYVFVKGGSNTYVYDPSTMQVLYTLPYPLTKMSVGSGKFVGMSGTTAYVYDLSDLSAAPITIPNNPSVDSTALFDNKLYVGQPDQNNNVGQITVYDLNDLNASPTLVYSSSSKSNEQFAKKIRVAGNKLFATQNRALNEPYGIIQVWDTNDLSAAPTVINNPLNVSLDRGWMEVTETHLVFSSAYGYEGSLTHAGTVYVYDLNDLSSPQATVTATNRSTSDYFGKYLAVSSKYLMVQNDGNARKVHVFDMTDLSAAPVELNDGEGATFGRDLSIVGDNLFVGESDVNTSTGRLFVYDGTDLSSAPQEISGSAEYDNFTSDMVGYPAPSALNGVTVAQSDNVLTVTPGTQDASFTLNIKATDSNGNVTTVPATFALDYQNQAPSVTGIQSAYTLTQGQDTVITAAATDPEGDAITWSYEEVMSGGGANYVAVGAHGQNEQATMDGGVFIYDASDISSTPIFLTTPNPQDYGFFGKSVAGSSDTLFVSATGENKVYTFDTSDFSAAGVPIPTPSQYTSGDYYTKVVVGSGKLLVSTRYKGDTSNQSGSVYVYDLSDLSAEPTRLTTNQSGDRFAWDSLACHSDKIYVGAVKDGSNDGAIYVYDANNLSATPTKLTAFDGGENFYFGKYLTVNDHHVIVGHSADDDVVLNSGAIYVYDVNNIGTTPTKLKAFDAAEGASFGYSVVTTADKIIVGAYRDDDEGTDSGSVYVYDANDLSAQPTKLTPSDGAASDMFGRSLSITSDKLFVGTSTGENGYQSGSFYVYDLNDLSAQPTEEIPAGIHNNSEFSSSMATFEIAQSALNGTTVAQSDNVFTVTPAQQDATFQLTFKATDSNGNVTTVPATFSLDYQNQAPSVTGIDAAYTLTQGQGTVITAAATDPEGDAITWSYEEVASGSSYVIVGSKRDDNVGAAYIYDWDGSSVSNEVRVTLDTTTASDFTGSSVATNGSKVVIGSERNSTGTTRAGAILIADMDGSNKILVTTSDADTNDYIGTSVAINSTKVAVGAHNDDDAGSRSGSVYLFDLDGTNEVKITASDAAASDFFGYSVALTETKVIVGSRGQNGSLGSIYVYDLDGSNEVQFSSSLTTGTPQVGSFIKTSSSKMIVGSDNDGAFIFDLDGSNEVHLTTAAVSNTGFGKNVAISESKAVVCAKNTGNSAAGEAFIFDLDGTNAIKITAPTPELGDGFGCSVEIVGDKVLVGADHMYQSHGGRVYIYNLDGTYVSYFESDYVSSEVGDNYAFSIGSSVPAASLGGTTVAQSDNVFTVTPAQQDATFQLTFKATDTAGNVTSTTSDFDFTYVNQAPSVTGIESSYLLSAGGSGTAITAVGTDPEGDAITWSFEEVMSGGSTYVFVASPETSAGGEVKVYQEGDLNTVVATLSPSDVAAGDAFGYAMTVAGDKVAIASRMDDNNGAQSGSVYVYDTNDFSAAPVHLVPSDGSAYDYLGGALTSNSDKIVAMASSSKKVYVWDTNDLGGQPTVLSPSDASGDLGWGGLEIVGDNLLIGDPGYQPSGTSWIYVYDLNDLSTSPSKITRNDATQGVGTGGTFPSYYGLASNGTYVAVGHDNWTTGSGTQGAVYLFSVNDFSAPVHTIYAKDNNHIDSSVTGTAFGSGIGLSDDKLFVGNWNHTGGGAVYVYDLNDLTAQPSLLTPTNGDVTFSYRAGLNVSSTHLYVGAKNSSAMYAYALSDLSAAPTRITGDGEFGHTIISSSGSSALNGTTVAQSDNVFTVTPGSEATSFSMRFTATDANGNATTTTSAFTVQESVMPDHPLLTGRTIVVGAAYDDEAGSNAGAIYMYENNSFTKITPPTSDSNQYLTGQNQVGAFAVGTTKFVAASKGVGKVYVYTNNGILDRTYDANALSWNPSYFGQSIAIQPDVNNPAVAIKVSQTDGGRGRVILYASGAEQWYKVGSETDGFIGDSMAMSNFYLFVGHRTRDYGGTYTGEITKYQLSNGNQATQIHGVTNEMIGANLAVSTDRVVDGSFYDNQGANSNYKGSVSIYNHNLNLITKIDSPLGNYSKFGSAIDVSGNRIVVGAEESPNVYVYDKNGNSVGTITGQSNHFGQYKGSIAVYGTDGNELIAIGEWLGDAEGSNYGDVYLYDGNLNLIGRLSGHDGGYFGSKVGII